MVNEQVIHLTLGSGGFSAMSLSALPPVGLPTGYALLTMFVNGVPSTSQIVAYTSTVVAQTIAGFPNNANQPLSESYINLQPATSAGLSITYSLVSGPATVTRNVIFLNGVGTVVVTATAEGNSLYLPYSVTETFKVVAPMAFTDWEQQTGFFVGGQAATGSIGGWTATPEKDGVANGLKYLCNINPATSMGMTDQAALPVVKLDTTTLPGITLLALTYRQNAVISGVGPTLETSKDLQTWTVAEPGIDQQVGTDPTTGDPIMEVGIIFPPNGSNIYIRLQVTGP